jgi:hypothetical protein
MCYLISDVRKSCTYVTFSTCTCTSQEVKTLFLYTQIHGEIHFRFSAPIGVLLSPVIFYYVSGYLLDHSYLTAVAVHWYISPCGFVDVKQYPNLITTLSFLLKDSGHNGQKGVCTNITTKSGTSQLLHSVLFLNHSNVSSCNWYYSNAKKTVLSPCSHDPTGRRTSGC